MANEISVYEAVRRAIQPGIEFGKMVARDFPQSVAKALQHFGYLPKEITPATEAEKFLLGGKPVQKPEGKLDIAFTALGLFPVGIGSLGKTAAKTFVKGSVEELAKAAAKQTAKQVTKKAVKEAVEGAYHAQAPVTRVRTVTEVGGKLVERDADDVLAEMNALRKSIEGRAVKREAIIQSNKQVISAEIAKTKDLTADITKDAKALFFSQRRTATSLINDSIERAMPKVLNELQDVLVPGKVAQIQLQNLKNIRQLQTELDDIGRALAELPQDETVILLKNEIKELRATLGRIPEEAQIVGKEMRAMSTRIRHLERAIENQYDLDQLRSDIFKVATSGSDAPSLPFGRRADLLFRTYFGPAESGLKGLGNAGKTLYERSRSSIDVAERRLGRFLSKYTKVSRGISAEERARVTFNVLEGRAVPMSRAGAKLAQFLRQEFDDVIKVAQDLGVEARRGVTGAKEAVQRREAFAPHILDFKKLETQEGRAAAIEHLIRTGQTRGIDKAKRLLDEVELKNFANLSNVARAELLLNKFIMRQRTGGAFFGSLSKVRILDMPPDVLVTDIDQVVGRYFGSVYEFLENVKNFGQANEKVAPLLSQIAKEKGQGAAQFAEQFIRNITGGNVRNTALEGAVDFITDVQVATKLGLSVIPNVGQSMLTVVKVGLAPVIRELPKLGTEEGREFAMRSGAVVAAISRRLTKELGSGKFGDSILTATGFNFVEKEINRSLTPLVGRGLINDIYVALKKNPFDSALLRQLDELRIDPKSLLRSGPIERFQEQAALRLTKMTQFGEGFRAMPLAASSQFWGKILYQFKQFPINATRFAVNQVLAEAKHGNVAPLIRTLTLVPLAGEVINDISFALRGKQRTESPVQRYLENIFAIGIFGIMYDMYRSASYGDIAGFFGGPTVGTAADILEPIAQGDEKRLLRNLTRQVPVAGPVAVGEVLPTKTQEKEQKKAEFLERRLQPFTSLLPTLENVAEGEFFGEAKRKKTKMRSF